MHVCFAYCLFSFAYNILYLGTMSIWIISHWLYAARRTRKRISNVLRCAQAKGTSTPSSDAGNGLAAGYPSIAGEKVLLYRRRASMCIDKIDTGKLCVASRPGVLLKNLKSNSPRLSDLVGSNFLLSKGRAVSRSLP